MQEGKLFTGPAARRMIGAPGIGIPKPGPDIGYTVFIQNQSRGSRCLIKGSVLYYKKGATPTMKLLNVPVLFIVTHAGNFFHAD